ncbi:DUF3575 domain-containing protein [Sediminibacterium sp.]|uniref:DUF3575 domain-containing protein n=1 Tax=Sediminibacterium sp. TaxID=1917865 RepID=UPI003F7245AD
MKKLLLLAMLLPVLQADAQKLIGGKNIIKWNVGSMAARNLHFTYERSLTKNISFSLSYRTMSKGALPFKDQFQEAINSNDINLDNFQIGNSAITPELRFYLSLGRMKGFYIAPYARFATFDLGAPIKFTASTSPLVEKEALFNGKIKSTSAGLMIGYQFQIATKLVFDFQIIGGHYGTSKGDLNFASTLNSFEQTELKKSLDDIDAKPFKFTSTVNGSGAQIKSDGPWAGIRAVNIGIGLRF